MKMREKITIEMLDEDQPKDMKIWSVWLDGFDLGELNSYMLTHEQAIKMCHTSYDAGEGTKYTVYVPDDYKRQVGGLVNKDKMIHTWDPLNTYRYNGSVPGRTNTECNILKMFEKGDYVDIVFLDGFKITTSVSFVK